MDKITKTDRIFSIISRLQARIESRSHLYFYFKTVDTCFDKIVELLLKKPDLDDDVVNVIYSYVESVNDIISTPNFEENLIEVSTLEYISNQFLVKMRTKPIKSRMP